MVPVQGCSPTRSLGFEVPPNGGLQAAEGGLAAGLEMAWGSSLCRLPCLLSVTLVTALECVPVSGS